jgi:O-antigen/teichoic acid export membrane protein
VSLLRVTKAVFSIGLFVYAIKIILTFWEKVGPVYLGKTLSPELLGVFTFGLFVASKVNVISDAITDVTLPSLTEVYENSRSKFKEIFIKGNSKAYFLIMFSSASLIILKEDLFGIIDFVYSFIGKDPISLKYSLSFTIMDPLIIGFWAYSHINLLKSGISVPAKKMWESLFSYVALLSLTVILYNVFYSLLGFDPLYAFTLGMSVGGVLSYIFYILLIKRSNDFWVISKTDIIYTLLTIGILGLYYFRISPIIVFICHT